MKMIAALIALALSGLFTPQAHAQTVLTSAYVAGCPTQPLTWPVAGTCKYQFYPLTDTTHAIASVSKSAPVYAHTYARYAATPTVPLVACPAGATLSQDQKTCTVSGADASALIAYSKVASFSVAPPAPSDKHDYTLSWSTPVDGFLVQHSGDGGKTWEVGVPVPAATTSYTYPALSTSTQQCFRVSTVSKMWGTSDPTVTCVPGSGAPLAPATVQAK